MRFKQNVVLSSKQNFSLDNNQKLVYNITVFSLAILSYEYFSCNDTYAVDISLLKINIIGVSK